jgi:hypothetical protein
MNHTFLELSLARNPRIDLSVINVGATIMANGYWYCARRCRATN